MDVPPPVRIWLNAEGSTERIAVEPGTWVLLVASGAHVELWRCRPGDRVRLPGYDQVFVVTGS